MEHQWFCGGLDPCACMDSWKEAELEKKEKRVLAEMDAFVEVHQRLWADPHYREMVARAAEADFIGRLESNVGKAISGDPAKPIVPPFEEMQAKIKAEERARGPAMEGAYPPPIVPPLRDAMDAIGIKDGEFIFGDTVSPLGRSPAELLSKIKAWEEGEREEFMPHYYTANPIEEGRETTGGPGPSIVPPFGPLPCVHDWAFLRHDTSLEVDVFFCRRCLEYRTKEG